MVISPIIKGKVIAGLASGQSQLELSNNIGISRSTVSKLLSKHRNEIDALSIDLAANTIRSLRDIHVDTMSMAAKVAYALDQCDLATLAKYREAFDVIGIQAKDILKIADTQSSRIAKMLGLIGANTSPSIFLQQINNESSKDHQLSPDIIDAIGRAMSTTDNGASGE